MGKLRVHTSAAWWYPQRAMMNIQQFVKGPAFGHMLVETKSLAGFYARENIPLFDVRLISRNTSVHERFHEPQNRPGDLWSA